MKKTGKGTRTEHQRAAAPPFSCELSNAEIRIIVAALDVYPAVLRTDNPEFAELQNKMHLIHSNAQPVQISRVVQGQGSSSESSPNGSLQTPIAGKTGANARQVGGMHYKTAIEHWDFAAHNNMDYFQGQITKYVTRWKKKKGVEDLEKALHFLQKYMELIQQGVVKQKEETSK